MTKEEIITKWQKEADDWKQAKLSETFADKTKEMAYNREYQLLYCIEDLKQLDEYAHEAEAWLPYPENKPEKTDWYLVTIDTGSVDIDRFANGMWMTYADIVIAFRNLPAPYQERGAK